ncbi:MAG: HPr(Ser) kinase/phosphatase, partial [Pseudomonadota bacterium]
MNEPSSQTLNVSVLMDRLRDRLDLEWICGRAQAGLRTLSSGDFQERPAQVGFLNLIHPSQIQVLGEEELHWLDQLDAKLRWQALAEIVAARPRALLLASGLSAGTDLEEQARESNTPLLRSPKPGWELVSILEYEVARALARRIVLHGVFLEVFTQGVLVTGQAGAGKSELALELLTRGHRLIADDSPEFTQLTPDTIEGRCPKVLQDCLEVRGLGVLNVRRMFGDSAVKMNKFLRLILHLYQPRAGDERSLDRLNSRTETQRVMDMDIPRLLLPVLPGRNLAVIAEAAVRNF